MHPRHSPMRFAILLAAGVVACVLAASDAMARSGAAYCAVSRGFESTYEDCSYATFEACLAEIRGLGGHCRPNSYYVPPPPDWRGQDRRSPRPTR